MKGVVLIAMLIAVASLGMSGISAQEGPLPFRPTCNATYQGNDGSPLAEPLPPFNESFDVQDEQFYCYLNDSVVFIWQEPKFVHKLDMYGNPVDVRPTFAYVDFYVNEIGFEHSKTIGHPQDPVILKFDYYRPEWEIPVAWRPLFGGLTRPVPQTSCNI